MNLTNQSMNRWLAVRLDGLGACVALAAAVLAIQQKGHAAWMGLTLSYALQMTQLTGMTVRSACCRVLRCDRSIPRNACVRKVESLVCRVSPVAGLSLDPWERVVQ